MAEPHDPTLQAYLQAIARYPLLSPQQEIALGHRIAAGAAIEARYGPRTVAELRTLRSAARARQHFIRANLRLVVTFAKRFHRKGTGVEFLDSIQEGTIGLARAVERFDPTKGYRFSNLAYWWIRKYCSRHREGAQHAASTTGADAERLARLPTIAERLRQRLGHAPTDEDMAQALGVELHHLHQLYNLRARCASLDATVTGGGGERTPVSLLHILPDPASTPDAIQAARDENETTATVTALLEQLPHLQRRLLRGEWGIGAPPMTRRELARAEAIRITRVHSEIAAAMKTLRALAAPSPCPDTAAEPQPHQQPQSPALGHQGIESASNAATPGSTSMAS